VVEAPAVATTMRSLKRNAPLGVRLDLGRVATGGEDVHFASRMMRTIRNGVSTSAAPVGLAQHHGGRRCGGLALAFVDLTCAAGDAVRPDAARVGVDQPPFQALCQRLPHCRHL